MLPEQRTDAVEAGLQDVVEQVTVVNQLFSTMGAVSREQFRSFTTPLLARYPGIQALSYQRLIMHRDRNAYEKSMQNRYPDFKLTEFVNGEQRRAGNRDSYNVVDYIEPLIGNEAAVGLDTAVTPDQIQAREESRDTGSATATGLLTLVQRKGWHSGFLVLAPVYLRGVPLDSVLARHRAVIGETAAVFRTDHIIKSILEHNRFLNTPGMTISIYTRSGKEGENLVYQNGASDSTENKSLPNNGFIPSWLWLDHTELVSRTFILAGSQWHTTVAKAPVIFYANQSGSLFVLLGGILFSALAAAFVFTLASRKTTIERAISERTAALQFANLRLSEDLEQGNRAAKSLRLHKQVIDVSSNAIMICSAEAPDYAVEYVNPAFETITGYGAAEVVGRSLESLQGYSKDQQNLEEIRAALREKREGHALLRNYRKDGGEYWNDLFIAPVKNEQGIIHHFVVAQYDIAAVMRHEAELEFQAKHDALTALANRDLLRDRLSQAILDAHRNSTSLWVLFVDLDRFKFINDTLGHDAGDILLKVLATRLQSAARDADTLARVGGDEFVLVLPAQSDHRAGLIVLQQIMDAVAQPLTLQGYEFFLTCSIGIATYPKDGDTAEALTKNADIAMYKAKEMGRSTFQFYNPAMNQRTLDRLSIEADLRHSLERNEFSLVYQPQLSVSSGSIVGMEALIRWNHPVHGMITPARFIALAEEMGLIVPIGAWVLHTACIQAKAWQLAGLGNLRVAVNLSARQFTEKALVQSIADVLHATGLDPQFLELELTESMVMSDVDNVITTLRNLKGLGINISIDDFGTGYSSLSYLRRFPIDVLKIDQSFIKDLSINSDDAAIVVSIISLAHSLRLNVIAEGVETEEQLAFLREHGCDQMQGYYFSKALAPREFESLLRSTHSLPEAIQC